MAANALTRLRKLCLKLPDAFEVEAWGAPTFRGPSKKLFAMFSSPDNHHGAGRPGVWIKSTPPNQALLTDADPERFFVPPYVGPSGWIGVWLDTAGAWRVLPELLAEGYQLAQARTQRARKR